MGTPDSNSCGLTHGVQRTPGSRFGLFSGVIGPAPLIPLGSSLFPMQRCFLLSCLIYKLSGFAGMEGEQHNYHRDN